MVASRPKVSFEPNDSTGSGNYGWLFAFYGWIKMFWKARLTQIASSTLKPQIISWVKDKARFYLYSSCSRDCRAMGLTVGPVKLRFNMSLSKERF
jgi:hypothetical protein